MLFRLFAKKKKPKNYCVWIKINIIMLWTKVQKLNKKMF